MLGFCHWRLARCLHLGVLGGSGRNIFTDLATTCSWVSCVFQTSRTLLHVSPCVPSNSLFAKCRIGPGGFLLAQILPRIRGGSFSKSQNLRKIAFLKTLPSETCFFSWILEIFQFFSWKMVSWRPCFETQTHCLSVEGNFLRTWGKMNAVRA